MPLTILPPPSMPDQVTEPVRAPASVPARVPADDAGAEMRRGFDESARMASPEERRDVLWLIAGGLAFFGINMDFMMRGDATTYANYVLTGRYDHLTLHLGYYRVLQAVQATLGRWFDVPIHETMVYLNVAFGALTLAVAYLVARRLLGARREAIVVAVLMAVCGRVLTNATSSEIYMLQTFVVLVSVWQYLSRRYLVAGIAAGLAMLVSPLSAFAYLFFPAYELTREGSVKGVNWRAFGLMVLGGTVAYLPYLLVFSNELLYGHRGLLVIHDSIATDWGALTSNVLKYQFKHYTALLLLLLPALLLIRANRRLAILTLAVAVPHLYIVVKLTSEDNTFLLNTDFFFCCWLALGMRAMWEHAGWRRLVYLPLAGQVAILLASGRVPERHSHRDYAAELRAIAKTYLVDKPTVLISDWDVGMSVTHFGRDSAVSLVEADPLYAKTYDITVPLSRARSLPTDVELLLLDPWEPTPLNAFFRSKAEIEQQREEYSVRREAERRWGLRCDLLAEGTHPLYRCVRVDAGAADTPSAVAPSADAPSQEPQAATDH